MNRLLGALLVVSIAIPTVALAADTDPKKQITAADRAKARSIVLKRSDFAAGWKRLPPVADDEPDPTCPGFNPDQSDLTMTGEAEGNFEHPDGMLVQSSSEIYVSKSDALKSWSRSAKPALARCIAYLFRQGVIEDGGVVKIVTQGLIAFPKVAPRTLALRVVARVTVEQPGKPAVQVPVTLHVVGVGNGRGDATLFTLGPGTGVPPAALHVFAKLLATRLAAAKL